MPEGGIQPCLTVIVATAQALKMHGGAELENITRPDKESLVKGLKNLQKHLDNMNAFGQSVVVAFNKYASDTEEEIALVEEFCRQAGAGFAVNSAFADGGEGAVSLAETVVEAIEHHPSGPLTFTYRNEDPVTEKIAAVACKLYGAAEVTYSMAARKKLKLIQEMGIGHYPVCIAKTQYSFSTDPKCYGCAEGFEVHIKDLVINNGAEMIVAVAGDIMRMPGLPKSPQAERIDLVNGLIEGLS